MSTLAGKEQEGQNRQEEDGLFSTREERQVTYPPTPVVAPREEHDKLMAESKYGISKWGKYLGLNDFSLWKPPMTNAIQNKNRLGTPLRPYRTSLSVPLSFL